MLNRDTLLYQTSTPKKSAEPVGQLEPTFYKKASIAISPKTMTLLILPPESENYILSGDEIGVFDSEGNLAGAYVYEGSLSGIMIYGDDEETSEKDGLDENEPFFIRIWNKETNTEKWAELNFEEGSQEFKTDALAVASLNILEAPGLNSQELKYITKVFPNPASNSIVIELNIPTSQLQKTKLKIYSSKGQLVFEKEITTSQSKVMTANWSLSLIHI